jgi:hypothetical protein
MRNKTLNGYRCSFVGVTSTVFLQALLISYMFTPRASAQFPSFELTSLSQPVAQIGSSFELTLAGSRTDELHTLFFSAAQVTAEPVLQAVTLPAATPTPTGKFKVQVAKTVKPGPCEVRGLGRYGLSNPRRMMLVSKQVTAANADHSSTATALELSSDRIVCASCQPQKRNYYRVQLAAGQALHLTVYAQQLDSRAMPVVTLLDAEKQILARGRSFGSWPATIDYQAADPVELLIVVHDAIYLGGPDYPYALECTIGNSSTNELKTELDQVLLPSLKHSANHLTRVERMAISSSEPTAESDAHNTQLPLHAEGAFPADRSACSHDFEAVKDQQLTIEVTSHSAQQLTDPRLILYRLLPAKESAATTESTAAISAEVNFTQQQVLEQDDPPVLGDVSMRIRRRDPMITWSVPEAGRYRAVLLDNESSPRRPEEVRYVLDIRPARPDFQLLAYPPFPSNNPALARPIGLNLIRGGSCSLRVVALRREGFEQPIEVILSGLPAGVQANPITLHPSQSEATINLTCNESAEAWSGPIQITGQTIVDSKPQHAALTASIVWPAIPTHNAVQSRLSEDLMLHVNPLDTNPVSVAIGSETTLEVKQGEKLSIPVRLTRRVGGAAACVLRPQSLLSKITTPELTIAADKSEGSCEISVAADAPLGEFSFWLQNETKIKWRDNPQALAAAEKQLADYNAALAQTKDGTGKSGLEEAIRQVTASIETLKKSTAEKELTVFMPSNSQRIRVIPK